MENTECFLIKVYGYVQGVGFRYFIKTNAKRLGLRGYTSNKSDGSVEILIKGNSVFIKEFLNTVKQGNSLSRVDKVSINKVDCKDFKNYFKDEFYIKY